MVANKDEAQGNVTTNAKGRYFNNIVFVNSSEIIFDFLRNEMYENPYF